MVVGCVMLMVCLERMSARPVKHADLAATQQATYLINVNQADKDELCLLPRVGPGIAQRIIDTRRDQGEFHQPRDLTNVPMIGEKTVRALAPWIGFDEQ